MKRRNTGNGIQDNGDGTATVKVGAGIVTIRYEAGKEAVRIVPLVFATVTRAQVGMGRLFKVMRLHILRLSSFARAARLNRRRLLR